MDDIKVYDIDQTKLQIELRKAWEHAITFGEGYVRLSFDGIDKPMDIEAVDPYSR